MNTKGIRFLQIVVFLGIILLGVKFFAWRLTNSNAILTDALESIINVVAGGFALYSLILASKPRDANHPYGHGKIEFISAGFEGALILIVGCVIVGKSVYDSIHPHPVVQLDIGIALTAITGSINFAMGFFLERQGRKLHSMSMIGSGKHLKTDGYSSLALILGLYFVILSKNPLIDNIIAVLFGGLIIYTGFRLVRKSIAGIMDEADYQLIEKVIGTLEKYRKPEWIDVHNLRIIKYGRTLHIDCHLTLPWYFDTRKAHDEVKALEKMINTYSPQPVEFFIHVDPCELRSCQICTLEDCKERRASFKKQAPWNLENAMINRKHSIDNALNSSNSPEKNSDD